MVAERVSAKGPHSLIRRNRRKGKEGGGGKETTPLCVCLPAEAVLVAIKKAVCSRLGES